MTTGFLRKHCFYLAMISMIQLAFSGYLSLSNDDIFEDETSILISQQVIAVLNEYHQFLTDYQDFAPFFSKQSTISEDQISLSVQFLMQTKEVGQHNQ